MKPEFSPKNDWREALQAYEAPLAPASFEEKLMEQLQTFEDQEDEQGSSLAITEKTEKSQDPIGWRSWWRHWLWWAPASAFAGILVLWGLPGIFGQLEERPRESHIKLHSTSPLKKSVPKSPLQPETKGRILEKSTPAIAPVSNELKRKKLTEQMMAMSLTPSVLDKPEVHQDAQGMKEETDKVVEQPREEKEKDVPKYEDMSEGTSPEEVGLYLTQTDIQSFRNTQD